LYTIKPYPILVSSPRMEGHNGETGALGVESPVLSRNCKVTKPSQVDRQDGNNLHTLVDRR